MSTVRPSAAAEAATVIGDRAELVATQNDSLATRIDPPRASPTGRVSGAGLIPLIPEVSPGTATLRNITVLPHVEGVGRDTQLKPRSETRYQQVKHLGAGAMGEVNLAKDNDIGRTVAVKQLVASTQNPAGVARFIDEIRTIGQLEHPNIVPIHDVGVDQNGQIFFVMKYIEGETLESVIRKLQDGDPAYLARFTIDYRVEIFLGLLHALQCAHQKGVIHRDIKPANVMIGHFGEVVLMDWGIAKLVPKGGLPAGTKGEFIGTPAYMSPEQSAGLTTALDPRSDGYSAAVLFHELLCLRHYLGEGKNLPEILVAIASEPVSVPRLEALRHPQHPAPPAELLHFLVKALAKDPAQRFQNMDEMIDELKAMREGRMRIQCPVTLARRMTSEVNRHLGHSPRLSVSAFFAALILFVGCLGVTVRTLLSHIF